jgi:hypothetical protein
MTDPGGGFGWRAGQYAPPRRGRVSGFGGLAERATMPDRRPLAVLLLPEPLEMLEWRERVEDLLLGPGVAAVDPARISYRSFAKLPDAVVSGLAAGQARRMGLPGTPRVVVLFHPLQYPLARAIIAQHPDVSLWYANWALSPEDTGRYARRLTDLDHMASMRADHRFDPRADPELDPRVQNREMWERLEQAGVETGRLGSERPDVTRTWRPAQPLTDG